MGLFVAVMDDSAIQAARHAESNTAASLRSSGIDFVWTSVTTLLRAGAFYIQFPRLHTAVPISLPDRFVLSMPAFFPQVQVLADSGIASGADSAIDVSVTLYLTGRGSYAGST
jgi:hypothetical protein